MIKLIQGIQIEDELNVHLVANGLKPASFIDLDPFNFDEGYEIEKINDYEWEVHADSDIELKPEDISQLESIFHELSISYTKGESCNSRVHGKNDKLINYERIPFNIAKDRESLERLIAGDSDREEGLALGFPEEAVGAFGKFIDGEYRDGQYFQICLARAKQISMDLPTWLAYISFVPEQLDFVNGNVSTSSKKLGERYQDFVRANNPELAHRVEQNFLNRKFPDSWEILPNGSYSICYESDSAKVKNLS